MRALRHRNFRLYFIGHAISTLGTRTQQVALSWLIPQLLVGPFAGAWIDRHDKRRLLIMVKAALALLALILAGLTASEQIEPALIVIMAALLGVLNAVDTPLRQSLLSQFVDDRQDLPNALTLNTMLFTSSRFMPVCCWRWSARPCALH
ncbi:MFS transporter [Pseudomonas frederiksbergensis]|uniref:MFS transporter n=1 Tax=Pseudomonas frederiksbergensis TaxID=104087 RepID=UPI000AD99CA8|nr:MFS transporter [Pseudomonas frederiksbergensis]